MGAPDHAEHAGRLCKDDGSGCCGECGVSLSTCTDCDGVGYHREACPQMEEPPAAAELCAACGGLMNRPRPEQLRDGDKLCELCGWPIHLADDPGELQMEVHYEPAAVSTWWNGEPCLAWRGSVVVGKAPAPTWWCVGMEGDRREVVRVLQHGQAFYLDNEGHAPAPGSGHPRSPPGTGWHKVTVGRGLPQHAHSSVPVDDPTTWCPREECRQDGCTHTRSEHKSLTSDYSTACNLCGCQAWSRP